MNVFLVESPTQVLNALEAKNRFQLDDCHLLILLTGLFNYNTFKTISGYSDWRTIFYLKFYFLARKYDFGESPPKNFIERAVEIGTVLDLFIKRNQIDRLASRLISVEKLFLGQYRMDTHLYFRHFANRCKHKELILLDDGTDTLLINKQRCGELRSSTKDKIDPRKSYKALIKAKYGKWDSSGVESLTYFTNIKIEISDRDRLIYNDYRYLRSLARKNNSKSNRVFFLGQTLVDDGYITLKNLLSILSMIAVQLKNKELIYIAHPRESKFYLEKINTLPFIQVQRFDVPIEFEMTVNGNCPEVLAGFFCSALENCATIFSSEIFIQSYRINSCILLKNHEEVENIYSHLDKIKNINVIDIGFAGRVSGSLR